jgi:molybdopterin synthase catalytic subunit
MSVARSKHSLATTKRIGGLVVFVGLVREIMCARACIARRSMRSPRNYPGMTEGAGRSRRSATPLASGGTLIVHRHGRLAAGDRIVLVVVSSPSARSCLRSLRVLSDWLKTKAPFWKLEETPAGEKWVGAHEGDDEAAQRWQK